jgi:hypothetical protein
MRLPEDIVFYIGSYLYQSENFEWLYLNIGLRLMYCLKVLKIYDLYGLFRKLSHVSYGLKNKDLLNILMQQIYNYNKNYSKENFIIFDLFDKSNNNDLKNYYLPYVINHNVVMSPIQNLNKNLRERILVIYLCDFFNKNILKSDITYFQINKNINLKYIDDFIQFMKSINKNEYYDYHRFKNYNEMESKKKTLLENNYSNEIFENSFIFYICEQNAFDEKLKILEFLSLYK